ncbi:MAG: hypothetical protein J6N76_05995, partial [Lachnospiraceae bacterium]|nr:hypothetical protein [Lachnospiraceae bacterium]
VVKEKLAELDMVLKPQVSNQEPADFLDAMCFSIEANQSAAIKRLGGYLNMIPTYFRYRGIL